MKNNLIVLCAGPTSLHYNWLGNSRNFDVMIVDYGDNGHYANGVEYYIKAKGTKMHILSDVYEKIPKDYEYLFFPDDDLYFKADQVDNLFDLAKQYNLQICQPSLVGYYSLFITLHCPASILRYTNFVEIMCPCFSREALALCVGTFKYSKSCWGIELLWDKILGFPKDRIAIIDDVIVVHTRPCFGGDNYTNNNITTHYDDAEKLIRDNNLRWDKNVYNTIVKHQDFNCPADKKIYPPIDNVDYLFRRLLLKQFI